MSEPAITLGAASGQGAVSVSTGGPEERITARVNGCAVPVGLLHRYGSGRNGVLVTVTAPVRLSLEQAAAVLYLAGMNNTDEDLADDDTVRELVADAVVNLGCCELDAAQMEARDAVMAGGADGAFLALCRDRAAAVFTAAVIGGRRCE